MKKVVIWLFLIVTLLCFVSAEEKNLALDDTDWDVVPGYTFNTYKGGFLELGAIENINDGLSSTYLHVYQYPGYVMNFSVNLSFPNPISFLGKLNYEFEDAAAWFTNTLSTTAEVFNGSWHKIDCVKTNSVSLDAYTILNFINCTSIDVSNIEKVKINYYVPKAVSTNFHRVKVKEVQAIGAKAVVPSCTPDCSGKECGDDGCGTTCGTCSSGYSCEAGVCESLSCVSDDIIMKLYSAYDSHGALWNYGSGAETVCPSGMVGYWKLDGNAEDSFSNHDGVVNSVNFVNGKKNDAGNFDGTSSLISIPDSNSLDLKNFTLEAWFKANILQDSSGYNDLNEMTILAKGEDMLSDKYNYGMYLLDRDGFYSIGDTPKIACKFEDINDKNYELLYPIDNSYFGRFVHVACSLNDNVFKMYVDGSEVLAYLYVHPAGPINVASLPLSPGTIGGASPETGNSPFLIGAYYEEGGSVITPQGYSGFFSGDIDEVAVYNKTLSASEIKSHYNSGIGKSYCESVSNSYDHQICYSSIFGSTYTGSSPHSCKSNNHLLKLSDSSNAHAEIVTETNYPVNVCYGDLNCQADTSAGDDCTNGGKVVVRLSDSTNAHLSTSESSYPVKICCTNSVIEDSFEAYWANMRGEKIDHVCIGDTVKLVAEGSKVSGEVEYTVKKSIDLWFDKEMAQVASLYGFTTWKAGESTNGNLEGGDYIFTAKLSDGSEVNSETLIVSTDECNLPPKVRIISPAVDFKTKKGSLVHFEAEFEDDYDDLKATWFFGDGESIVKYNCMTKDCSVDHAYNSQKSFIVEILVEEMDRESPYSVSNYSQVLVYDEDLNVFSRIDEPPFGKLFSSGVNLVAFNANRSFASKCTTSSNCNLPTKPTGATTDAVCYDVFDSEGTQNLKCYDLPKDWIDAGYYDLFFNWTFSEGEPLSERWSTNYSDVVKFNRLFVTPGEHQAKLNIGVEIL